MVKADGFDPSSASSILATTVYQQASFRAKCPGL